VKRATPKPRSSIPCGSCFNPRPREAGDAGYAVIHGSFARFNPRPREAGDLQLAGLSDRGIGFNPRPREAGDRQPLRRRQTAGRVSIHARVKRATQRDRMQIVRPRLVSIHARVKRATRHLPLRRLR